MRTIRFTTSYEDLISRIPGLFAYVELDNKGISVLHKASDSPMGCYGKIVKNIKYCNISEVINVCSFKLSDGREIDINKIYSYKTLIDIYYSLLNNNVEIETTDSEDKNTVLKAFKTFIEYGIGKVEVNFKGLNKKENDLVPEYVYLATISSLYQEMLELQLKCRYYEEHKNNKNDSDIEDEADLCCKCVFYRRKGGDGMLEFLRSLFEERDKRVEWWYNNALKNKKDLRLNYSVNLLCSERDMGVVTPVENRVIKLKNNIDFDCKESNGDGTVTCNTTNKLVLKHKNNENEYEINDFDISFITNSKLKSLRRFKTYTNIYDEEERPPIDTDWLFYYRKGQICNLSVLNDDRGNILTEKTDINDINENIEVNDLMAYGDVIENIIFGKKDYPAVKPTRIPESIVYEDKEYPVKKCISFNNEIYLVKDNKVTIGEEDYPVDGDKVIISTDYEAIDNIIIYNNEEHIIENNEVEIEGKPYKVDNGKISVPTEYNIIGETSIDGKEYYTKNNVFTIGENKITFTYWTDVHLTAKCNGVKYDDDGNKKITYDKFEIDKGDTLHGVKYVETYTFSESSELNDITAKEFKDYVEGKNDGENGNKYDYKLFEKYEFSTYNNTSSFVKEIDYNQFQYRSILSDSTNITIKHDVVDDTEKKGEIVRLEFYDGVTYSPTEIFDVNIDRGTTTIFDKHIRFSEVKTLQDMEEYMNGSFFKIQ